MSIGDTTKPQGFDLVDYLRDSEYVAGADKLPRVFGLRLATVVDNNDPVGQYRVRVRIHNLHPPDTITASLPWARRIGAFGGTRDTKFGTLSPIPVGAPVVVAFVNGEPNAPFVLGSWYPGKLFPEEFLVDSEGIPHSTGQTTSTGFSDIVNEPTDNTDVSQREIKSPKGSVVRITDDDGSGNTFVEITTNGGTKILLNESTNELKIEAARVVVESDDVNLGSGALTGLDGNVSRSCLCAFTGAPHPDFSTTVKAKK